MADHVELGYWGIKGLAELPRWLLAYSGVKFTEYNPASYEEWLSKKNSSGLDFPNLPFLVDGDFKLTESKAIAHYICAKWSPDLLGTTPVQKAQVKMVSGVIGDIKTPVGDAVGKKDQQKDLLTKAFAADGKIASKLGELSKFLGSKQYIHGAITINDLEFAQLAYYLKVVSHTFGVENPVDKHDNLKKLYETVRALPAIKAHIESAAGKRPLSSPGYLPVDLKEDF